MVADYILAYEPNTPNEAQRKSRAAKREMFEKNLKQQGLELEWEDIYFVLETFLYHLNFHNVFTCIIKQAVNKFPKFLDGIRTRQNLFKGALSGLRQFLATESPLKIMKNPFYFTSKAVSVLKIFKFLS